MDGFVGDMPRTQGVDLAIELGDLYWAHEIEVLSHEVMEIAEGYVWFFHFCFEAWLENTLAFGSFKSVDLEKQFQNKIFVDEGLAIFDRFFIFDYVFHPFNDIILIRGQLLDHYFQSLAQFHIRDGVGCSQQVRGVDPTINLVPAIQEKINLV